MKKLTILLVVVFAMVLLAGCDWLPFLPGDDTPVVVEEEALSADVEIINWVQDEGFVAVNYEITNTGEVDIAYYKILFKVTYVDDSVYEIWYEKVGIEYADSEIVNLDIAVAGDVARIDVVDQKLTEWKFCE